MTGDRLAFLDEFTKQFFAAGDRTDLISEPQRVYARDIAAFASPKGTLDCITAFGRTDFRDDLTKVSVPTLVIHGDADGIVPFEVSGKRAHEAIEGSRLALIEGAPHGLNATHAEQFNEALLSFLERGRRARSRRRRGRRSGAGRVPPRYAGGMARVEKRPDRAEELVVEDEHLVEIDADELEEARRDPKVRAFAARADAAARVVLQSYD